jgi:hypothetical protein
MWVAINLVFWYRNDVVFNGMEPSQVTIKEEHENKQLVKLFHVRLQHPGSDAPNVASRIGE